MFDLQRDEAVLRQTPRVLRTTLEGLPPRWWNANYGEGTRSPREVVAHLIFGERTDWIPRARIILEKGESAVFEPFDRGGHAALHAENSMPRLLDPFESEREANLEVLRSFALTPAMLAKRGKHPALGPATLSHMLSAWVVHDLNHIAQICKALAYQHREAVGPCKQ